MRSVLSFTISTLPTRGGSLQDKKSNQNSCCFLVSLHGFSSRDSLVNLVRRRWRGSATGSRAKPRRRCSRPPQPQIKARCRQFTWKSLAQTKCQSLLGSPIAPAMPVTVVPFIVHTAATPLSSCQRMSALAVAVEVAGALQRASLPQDWRDRLHPPQMAFVPSISQIAGVPSYPATGCRPCRRR